MFSFSISIFLVIFVFYVSSNENDNNKYVISTKLISENGTVFNCSYKNDVVLWDGENITVVMTHRSHIDHALVKTPSDGSEMSLTTGEEHNKTGKFHMSSKSSGKWEIRTLTNEGATQVPNNPDLKFTPFNNNTYYAFQCTFNVKVQKKVSEEKPKDEDKTWMYLTGAGVLAVIIVIQTFVILYILKTKKIRRIEQLALSNNTRNASDTARYSTTPRKPSLKAKDEDAGSIYESLDVVQTPANDAPPPPPIETLPRPPKTDKVPLIPGNSQTSTPTRHPPATEEDRIRNRPPMPLPGGTDNATLPLTPLKTGTHPRTESNFTMRSPAKPKTAALAPAQIAPALIPPSPNWAAPKMARKPSAVNQDPLSNELNNILKKRQTGTIPAKPNKPLDVPEPLPETKPKPPLPMPQGLRPPTMAKPTTPMTPAKLTRPVPPKNIPVLPKPTNPTQPLLAPKPGPVRKWPPVESGAPPKPHPAQRPGQPGSQHSSPGTQKPPHMLPPRPIPVLPANEEEPEYAEYNEYNEFADDDDEEEWTYEPLTQYNIYSS